MPCNNKNLPKNLNNVFTIFREYLTDSETLCDCLTLAGVNKTVFSTSVKYRRNIPVDRQHSHAANYINYK
jgi:hypothetical protein